MLVCAGIDEAGYGPMLGPLAVACSAFVLEDHDPAEGPPNVWRLLSAAICRSRRDKRGRIAVEDSKKLKGPPDGASHPLRHLERGVLAFLPDGLPDDDDDFIRRVGAVVPPRPWYGSSSPLPVAQTAGELRIAAGRLRRAMDRAHVKCVSLRCELTDANEFNDRCRRMGNKANVNIGCVMQLADEVWRRWPDAHPRVIVDRQGGRTHYREELNVAWPEARVRILIESESLCRYRVTSGGRELTISFARSAESSHLPVALASMTAKYARELMMIRLNRFFTAEMPALRPTAGYVQDARRYLAEIAPVVRRLRIPREHLVRVV